MEEMSLGLVATDLKLVRVTVSWVLSAHGGSRNSHVTLPVANHYTGRGIGVKIVTGLGGSLVGLWQRCCRRGGWNGSTGVNGGILLLCHCIITRWIRWIKVGLVTRGNWGGELLLLKH